MAAEPELAASRARVPQDSPGPCRPEESGHHVLRQFLVGFFEGVGGWELHLNQNVLQNSGNFWVIPCRKKE